MDNGITIVNSSASYSRKTAARVVGEERLKPVDDLVSQAQKTYTNGVDTVKSKGVVGAAQDGVHGLIHGVQNAGSYAKKTVLEVNQTVHNGASAVKEKLDPALKSLYDKWLVPTGALAPPCRALSSFDPALSLCARPRHRLVCTLPHGGYVLFWATSIVW